MKLVTLIRGNDEAVVDENITATYENFIANGWTAKRLVEDSSDTPDTPAEKEVVRPARKAAAKIV